MDTDLKRRESIAALWREDMDAVKIKLDSVYKILKNQNSLRKNAETSDTRGYKKDFRHVDFIRGFNNSSYQKSPPETEESRIEVRFDQVPESQEMLMVNFNGKIDAVYTDLSSKIEALNATLKKVEIEVILTSNNIRRHETFIQSMRDETLKHHVSAIINDYF